MKTIKFEHGVTNKEMLVILKNKRAYYLEKADKYLKEIEKITFLKGEELYKGVYYYYYDNVPVLSVPKKFHKIRLEDLDLSVRLYGCLKNASFKTLGDLDNIKINFLLDLKNFGRKSLNELIDKINSF